MLKDAVSEKFGDKIIIVQHKGAKVDNRDVADLRLNNPTFLKKSNLLQKWPILQY